MNPSIRLSIKRKSKGIYTDKVKLFQALHEEILDMVSTSNEELLAFETKLKIKSLQINYVKESWIRWNPVCRWCCGDNAVEKNVIPIFGRRTEKYK